MSGRKGYTNIKILTALVALIIANAECAIVILQEGPQNPNKVYYCGDGTNVLFCQLFLTSERYVYGHKVYGFIQIVVDIHKPDPLSDHKISQLVITDEKGSVVGYPFIVGARYWNNGYYITYRAEPTLKSDAFYINPGKPTIINVRGNLGKGFGTLDKIECQWPGMWLYDFMVDDTLFPAAGYAYGYITFIGKEAYLTSIRKSSATNVVLRAYGRSNLKYRVQSSSNLGVWLSEAVECTSSESGEILFNIPVDPTVRSQTFRLITD